MSDTDALHERGKALEDLFFKSVDEKLLDQLRQDMERKEAKEALSHASGIENEQVLDELIKHRVNAETWAAVSLIPLVAVAWADGQMDTDERKAINQAMEENNFSSDSASFQLVNNWLNKKPGSDLLNSWRLYVSSLKQNIDKAALNQMHNAVMERARNVAKSAGGFLGIKTISSEEQSVLDELEKTFSG